MSTLILHKRFIPLAAALLALALSCQPVEEYTVSIADVNTEFSLFEEGISVPIGSTSKIVLGDLLNSAGESIGDFLKTDASGRLILTYEGSTSLSNQIAELDLANLAQIDGVDFSKQFSYHIGDIDPDNFSIDARQEEVSYTFTDVGDLDIEIDPVSTNMDALNFKAGLNKYKDAINGNSDLNLANQIGEKSYTRNVTRNATIATLAAAAGGSEFNIPKELIPNITVDETNIDVTVPDIVLHEDISAIRNIATKNGAKMRVTLSISNNFLSDGEIVPDVDLDISQLLVIQGGSVIDLSGLRLNKGNSWSATHDYIITGLATTEYEGAISIDEDIVLGGTIEINDPKASSASLGATGDMTIKISITFIDLEITSADIAVAPVVFNHQDILTVGSDESFDLPEEVKTVKEVKMDQTKPIYLKITPSNLNILHSGKSLPYTIVLDFPEGMDVQGTVNGKLTLSGDLALGAVNEPIVIKSFYPTVTGNKVKVLEEIGVTADFAANNLVISSDDIPGTEAGDITLAVSIEGEPAISDILIETNAIEKDAATSDVLEFAADGMDALGSFVVTPSGNPAITVTCALPVVTGMNFVTGPEGILFTLPDVFEFDASGLDPSLTFNAENNTLLIQGAIPASIVLPISHLRVNPVQKPDGMKIVTSYAVEGKILVPAADVLYSDLQGISGAVFGITVNIPKITASSIALDDAFSYDIDESYDMDFELGDNNLLKSITELTLDEVFLSINASFTGLPDLGDGKYNVDFTLTLPDFITPSSIPIKGYIVDGALPFTPVKIQKISNVQIPENGKLSGQIKVAGSVSAESNNINLESLQSDINIDFSASIGNASGKIALSKATGVISYQLDNPTTVKLDNLPEMLRDGSLSPDLDDPQITLSIKSNLGIPMKGDLDLIPYLGGSVQEENKISLHNIELPNAESAVDTLTKRFVICKSATTAPPDHVVLEADVTKLLTNIPDSIQISIKAAVDETVPSILEPSATYVLDLAYAITAPLAFGKDFHFSTTTDIDLSMIADYTEIGSFGITGKAVNDSPLNVNVEMVLLDTEDAEIPQDKASTIAIQGNTTSDIAFYLSPTDKTKKISKAHLIISVTAVEGVALTENSSLQLTDLAAVLPDGITYSVPTK
ncbi:MAG: hypothetical protein J5748_03970 [Bacteroidales bacterium]|nr:hypothetical protein [Bacteroidales bacterium]